MTGEDAVRASKFITEEIVPRGEVRIAVPGPNINVIKAQAILETQAGPGGCDSFETCGAFCNRSGNEQTCFDFAVANGLLDPEEAERVRKLIETEGPGGCRGLECELYCEGPGNELECLDFAAEQGFISQEELSEVRKFMEATVDGGPGGCIGRECETYCNDPNNRDECFDFAKDSGLIPPEELAALERIDKKMKESGGPGGCRTETDCMQYCSDTAHFDECAAFAVDTGLIPPDQAKAMLRQFIEIEKFGPPGIEGFGPPAGFAPGGFEGFGPPGFGPPGFGPGGFGPPPGFEAEFEAEFQSRFEGFGHFQEFFETGVAPEGFTPPPGFGFPPPGEFPGAPGVFPGPGEFPTPEEFPGFPTEFPERGAVDNSKVILERNPATGLFVLMIIDPEGIQEFSFNPVQGSIYSGAVSGCPREYKTETPVFSLMTFPYDSFIVDCQGNRVDLTISGEGKFPGPPKPEFPVSPIEFPVPQDFGVSPGELPSGFEGEFQRQFESEFQRQFEDAFQLRELESFKDVPTFPESGFQIPEIQEIPTLEIPTFPEGGLEVPEGFLQDGTQSLLRSFILLANIVQSLNNLSVSR